MGWTTPASYVSVVPSARRRQRRALYDWLGASAVIAGSVMLGTAVHRLRDSRSTQVVAAPLAVETVVTSTAPSMIVPCPSIPDTTPIRGLAIPEAPPKPGEARNGGSWKPRRRNRLAEDPWGI